MKTLSLVKISATDLSRRTMAVSARPEELDGLLRSQDAFDVLQMVKLVLPDKLRPLVRGPLRQTGSGVRWAGIATVVVSVLFLVTLLWLLLTWDDKEPAKRPSAMRNLAIVCFVAALAQLGMAIALLVVGNSLIYRPERLLRRADGFRNKNLLVDTTLDILEESLADA